MYVKALLVLSFSSFVAADLRMASHPRHGYLLTDQGTTPWINPSREAHMHHRYMEPSTFQYKGLEHQKRRNYDNFLRSNIDNEQDNRNFNDEDGKDHLPFRTSETDVFLNYNWNLNNRRRKIQQDPLKLELAKVVKPGDSMMVPLRWNNPHASEMEVNIWIFEQDSKQPVVVPIRKPSCSGEGHQDNVISFTVPENFKALGSKIPGFKGCNEDSKPMCSLQIYSHSVESRTYAIGFPIVIPGHDTSLTTTDSDKIQSSSKDPLLDLDGLRDICLPATDASATISSAVPRWARLVSDVYNHAYQNSDYSPYSGQQHEHISKNLQASAVNKMEVGNRGELGKSILPKATYDRLRYLRGLENRVYKNYESLANKIINAVGSKMQNTGTIGTQQLANCFRCAEGGSTTTKRIQTNTYIPSFQLPNELVPAARKIVPSSSKYAKLITESGLVQIYVAAMNDLLPYFYKSRHLGIMYQPAVAKNTTATLLDVTNFKKRNKENAVDGGKYAATEAKKMLAWNVYGCPGKCLFPDLTKVNANACRGDDCKSIAKCPEGQKPIKCERHGSHHTDGITVTDDSCTVHGGHRRGHYAATALCAEQSISVAVSSTEYEENKNVTASCPAGESPLACYCHSPWRSCGGETFKASGSACTKTIGRSSRHRRRRGTGAKVYALCSKEAAAAEPLEFPLAKSSAGTNTTGDCAPCVQLFGKELESPPVTPLDNAIGWEGEPSNIANIPDNPDGEHFQPEDPKASLRRRRRR